MTNSPANGKNRRQSRRKKIAVIISGMPSVGKTTAAESIAQKFGLKHLAGGDMLKQMAYDRGYKPSGAEWWDSKEGMAFLSERRSNPNFDKEVDRLLIKHIHRGGVVVTSYPVPWIAERGLKIWFHASQSTRAARLAGRDHFSKRKALAIIKKRDIQNESLYKKLYGIRFGVDLSPFNFLIDTEKLSAKDVANASCKLISECCVERKK